MSNPTYQPYSSASPAQAAELTSPLPSLSSSQTAWPSSLEQPSQSSQSSHPSFSSLSSKTYQSESPEHDKDGHRFTLSVQRLLPHLDACGVQAIEWGPSLSKAMGAPVGVFVNKWLITPS